MKCIFICGGSLQHQHQLFIVRVNVVLGPWSEYLSYDEVLFIILIGMKPVRTETTIAGYEVLGRERTLA